MTQSSYLRTECGRRRKEVSTVSVVTLLAVSGGRHLFAWPWHLALSHDVVQQSEFCTTLVASLSPPLYYILPYFFLESKEKKNYRTALTSLVNDQN